MELNAADLAPRYADIVANCKPFLVTWAGNLSALDLAPFGLSIAEEHVFDPTRLKSRELIDGLHHLDALTALGRPILLGTSRKSTIGRILDLPADERLEGTLATTALGIASGVDIVRVHDVRANVRAARVADAIVRGRWTSEPEGGRA